MSSKKSETPAVTLILSPHVDYWRNRWVENKTGFHLNDVNPILIKFLDLLAPTESNHESKNIFVPLCGKTCDIAYLLSRGFKVFGVEGVAQPIEELNNENSFNLKFDQKESIYHTEDNQLQIYLGDLFECPIEKWGPFDYVWDRGSFIAVEYSDRPTYIEILKRSVSKSCSEYHNFRYLMETVRYDKNVYAGPPRSVDEKDMETFYGDWTNIEILNFGPVDSERVRAAVSSGSCDSVIYLLTPK